MGRFDRRPQPVFLDPDEWEARERQKHVDFARRYSGTPEQAVQRITGRLMSERHPDEQTYPDLPERLDDFVDLGERFDGPYTLSWKVAHESPSAKRGIRRLLSPWSVVSFAVGWITVDLVEWLL